MTQPPFDFTPYWPVLEDAMRRDPQLAERMTDPAGHFGAADWQMPDTVGEDTPSGHGSDRGIYVTKGHLAVLMMENDPQEHYANLPTIDNYYVSLEDTTQAQQTLRAVKLERGEFDVLVP
ncbi:hypothetical protein MF271_16600 [Deinococcus sp. KNUC1210]|uniref:hypothetical protein n=1 Tax=Deinococcus sp. KNUC1210 TaxID=2917691 RepID=UPI001EF0B5F1|nr:hypothetical protein [Deinococcus sp. KNUC1210]ULH15511.1 hypothetical protein MF271_16600 [Deinococcus sp. KNUC1210]